MLDIYGRTSAAPAALPASVEFFHVRISPLAAGDMFISLTATTVDEDEPQLLDQEIASASVTTIDEVLAIIKAHVRFNSSLRTE